MGRAILGEGPEAWQSAVRPGVNCQHVGRGGWWKKVGAPVRWTLLFRAMPWVQARLHPGLHDPAASSANC